MISEPEILETAAVEAAVIPITCRREDMPKVFGPAVQELFAVLARQGIASEGAVFAHHLAMPPENWEETSNLLFQTLADWDLELRKAGITLRELQP